MKKSPFKKTTTLLVAVLIASTSMLNTACTNYGCTNPKAENYDEEAEEDDETCEFVADLIFYSDSARTRDLVDQQINSVVTVYVNDVDAGTFNYYNHLDDTPDCDDDFSSEIYKEALKYTYTMANETEVVGVRVEDVGGNVASNYNVTVVAQECSPSKI